MSRQHLLKALEGILSEAGTQTQRFQQANRNNTTTQILAVDVEDIIKSWYWGLAKGDLSNNQFTGGKVTVPSKATLDKRWKHPNMKQAVRYAIDVYFNSTVQAISGFGNDVALRIHTPEVVEWTFYGSHGTGTTAANLEKKINKVAMDAMSKWIDGNWETMEKGVVNNLVGTKQSGNKTLLYDKTLNSSSGYKHQPKTALGQPTGKASMRGGIHNYRVFSHGDPDNVYADPTQMGPKGVYGSTYYAVRVLEELIERTSTHLKGFRNANPVMTSFMEDLDDLFLIDAQIELSGKPQGDLFTAHQEVVEIRGQIAGKKKQKLLGGWDRSKSAPKNSSRLKSDQFQKGGSSDLEGIDQKLLERIDESMMKIGAKIAAGDPMYKNTTIFDLAASPTQREKLGRKGVHNVAKKLKEQMPDAKVALKTPKPKKAKKTKAKTKGKQLGKKKKGSSAKGRTTRRRARKATTGSRSQGAVGTRANTGATRNPLALKALLQKSLPDEIAAKMTGGSTLRYRTGRFSDSAEIINVVPYPRSMEVQYTYMKDPYQVFEPESGSALATRGRDPQRIIGSTIRELAQGLMGDRFMVRTKRV